MTPERLAEIRRRTREHVEILARVSGLEGSDVPFDWRARAELVAEVDRLREGIESLAEWWQRASGDGGYEVACRDHAQHALALLNPSGASDD